MKSDENFHQVSSEKNELVFSIHFLIRLEFLV